MKATYIRKGDEFDTVSGYEVVTAVRNGFAHTASYEVQDNGEMEYSGKRMLTAAEIGRLMKEVDGENHTIIFVQEGEDK